MTRALGAENPRPNCAGDREKETDEEQVGRTGGARRQSWSLRQLQAGEEPEPPSKRNVRRLLHGPALKDA